MNFFEAICFVLWRCSSTDVYYIFVEFSLEKKDKGAVTIRLLDFC